MSLAPTALHPIPADTARVARAAFPHGNPYVCVRDQLGPLYADDTFAALFPRRGRPAESPGRLALVTVFQFAEDLSDRAAAAAVQTRMDWKYALGLELTDPGFDASVLTEFRARLVRSQQACLLFDTLLARLRAAHLVRARGTQRTDSTHVLAAVQALNRLACVGETLRHALDTLAVPVPDWLRAQVAPDWFLRYSRRFDERRLPHGRHEREALGEQIGRDGHQLLTALYADTAPALLRTLPAVETLRLVWLQQYQWVQGVVRWREAGNLPPAPRLIYSPYDVEARYSQKRDTEWRGCKVHLTESCDPDGPLLITDVQTTPATTPDVVLLPVIHEALAARDLLPREHLVDAGYVSGPHLVQSAQQHQVTVVGPTQPDRSWQARTPDAYGLAAFAIDWTAQQMRCPQGQTSVQWRPGRDARGAPVVRVQFARAACAACPARAQCTRAATGPRTFTLSPQATHEALQAARQREQTDEFRRTYRRRAGVEGTLSQGVRLADLRQARYRGLAKTHLQHLATAAALNLRRVAAWLERPTRARTRQTAFAALAPPAA